MKWFKLFFFIMLSLIISVSDKVEKSYASPLSGDDFESYEVGVFPSAGGWILVYPGQGKQYQYVDDTHSVSGAKSFHLAGRWCGAAQAYLPVEPPIRSRLEANIYVDQMVHCGCTPGVAIVGLFNPGIGDWGTGYGSVVFACDGNIYAVHDHYNSSTITFLMPYQAKTWYHVRSDINLETRTFDVYIDNVLYGKDLQFYDSGMPTGLQVVAGHGSDPTSVVWFDDVMISKIPDLSGCIEIKGQPLVGSLVILQQPGKQGKQKTLTDSNGCYAFDDLVPNKKFKITIE